MAAPASTGGGAAGTTGWGSTEGAGVGSAETHGCPSGVCPKGQAPGAPNGGRIGVRDSLWQPHNRSEIQQIDWRDFLMREILGQKGISGGSVSFNARRSPGLHPLMTRPKCPWWARPLRRPTTCIVALPRCVDSHPMYDRIDESDDTGAAGARWVTCSSDDPLCFHLE